MLYSIYGKIGFYYYLSDVYAFIDLDLNVGRTILK